MKITGKSTPKIHWRLSCSRIIRGGVYLLRTTTARSSDIALMLTNNLLLRGLAVATLITSGSPAVFGQSQKPPQADQVQPAPPAAAAVVVSPDFVVGPEDVLGILFWREPDFSGDVAVRPDGRITLPLIGDIAAAGVTPAALREQIQTAAAKYLTDPNVTVVVRQINSRKVFITGQIAQPGSYPLTGPRTVMQLISLAGGVTQYAKTEEISILRQEQGRTRALTFNYKDVSLGKNVQQNVQLQPGDTIVVPE
jgi:polysaccharide export outer membrane protein